MDMALSQGELRDFTSQPFLYHHLHKDSVQERLVVLALQNRQLYCWRCKLGLSVV